MKPLSVATRQNVVSLLESGRPLSEIAKRTGVSKTSVHRMSKKFTSRISLGRSGAPKKLTGQDCRQIVRLITSGKCDTAVGVAKELCRDGGMSICANTVANALKTEGFASAPKMKKPLLSKKHRQARLEFAQRHQHWTDDDWGKVVWSDESKINRFGSDGRKWCWKKVREGLLPRHVQPTLKFGGGSIMVWGCMTAQGVGYMAKIDNGLDADLYCEILRSDLMQTLAYYELDTDQVIFQQDNDPKHTSRKATQVLKDLSLDVLKWPAQSPDLNPIEHLWDFLKRKLADYPTQPKGMLELWDRVQETWESIDKETCLHLIKSMPRRIEAVLKARGGYTKY